MFSDYKEYIDHDTTDEDEDVTITEDLLKAEEELQALIEE